VPEDKGILTEKVELFFFWHFGQVRGARMLIKILIC